MNRLTSYWIGPNRESSHDVGVFVFRCEVTVSADPEPIVIDLSADTRYKLFVNGKCVAHGPQRGDLGHWFFDTVNLTEFLREGLNEVRAVVWNFGWDSPVAQISHRTGFVCRSDDPRLSTPGQWQVGRLEGWTFQRKTAQPNPFYMEVGPGEGFDSRFPGYLGDLDWREPNVISDWRDTGSRFESIWAMTSRTLPNMEYRVRPDEPVIRRGFRGDDDLGPREGSRVTAALDLGNRRVVLDYLELLCAYPRFEIEGEAGVTVIFTFDESLWEAEERVGVYGSQPHKGHRDAVEGKEPRGYQDHVILSDTSCVFEPLWWRTYRFITIEANGPATLRKVEAIETGYPYTVKARFESDEPLTSGLWNVAVRTAQRCAGETYFDCPYYEQLQYAGDTRIQALIHYYLSDDRRLARNAVDQLGWSLQSNGLTQSRYPNRTAQFIPPFCLWWIQMLYDQMLYDGETTPSEHAIQIAKLAKSSFAALQQDEKNGQVAHWMFADWVPSWDSGVPAAGGLSTIHTLTYLLADYALRCVEIGGTFEKMGEANRRQRRELLARKIRKIGGLVRAMDDPTWHPSEHAEALFRILQAMNGDPMDPWPTQELANAHADETTLYFSFYKHQAIKVEDYWTLLDPWRQMIEDGLTTFAETPEPARSDCHAWSAHPILGFFQQIAGITSAAPKWGVARVAPKPGRLKRFHARIPHPRGELELVLKDNRFELTTPVTTHFVWNMRSEKLAPGSYRFEC